MAQRIRCIAILLLTIVAVIAAPANAAKTILNVVGHWNPPNQALFMASATKYMELNPDIEIRFIHVPTNTYEGISKILLMQGGQETNPDIIHAYTAIIPEMLVGDMLAPVPAPMAKLAQRFFVPQILPPLTYKGQLHGLPTENQTYVLGYNERIFAESGIVEAPTNWDTLRRYAQKLTRIGGDGKVERYGLSMGGTFQEFTHELLTLIWGNGGEYIDDNGQVRLNTPQVYETVEYLLDMFKSNLAAVKIPDIAHGRSGMALMPTFRRMATGTDYQYVRTVVTPVNKGKPVAYQYGWGFFVPKQSRNAEEAWKFLQWMTMERNEAGRTRQGEHMVTMGSLPSNLMDLSGHDVFRNEQFFAGFLASLNISRNEPVMLQMTRRQQVIRDQIFPVITGATPLPGALEQLQKDIEMILKENVK